MKNAPVITSHKDWQDLIGIKYALTGDTKSVGLTCYGLVREVYQLLNIQLPEHQETSADGATITEGAGNDWTQLDEPVPYAVALIRAEGNASAFHLAIVTPELTLLHSIPRKGVIVSPVRSYRERIVGFYTHTPGCGQRLPLADRAAGAGCRRFGEVHGHQGKSCRIVTAGEHEKDSTQLGRGKGRRQDRSERSR